MSSYYLIYSYWVWKKNLSVFIIFQKFTNIVNSVDTEKKQIATITYLILFILVPIVITILYLD